MQTTSDVFTNAFQVLASVVRDFHINGRQCLGATLKPRLYQQGLNEKLLGFNRFGDFLRAAEVAGYVRLCPTPGGDIGVSPGSSPRASEVPPAGAADILPTAAAVVQPTTRASGAPIRVRQDLWNAFNSLSDRWVYDPANDRAFKESLGTGQWDGQQLLSRANAVPIPPGRERITEWMRSFTDMQDPDIRAQLSNAIERGAGLYEFNNLARSKGLLRLWSRFHIQNVLAAIEAWAASNRIQPNNVAAPLHPPTAIMPLGVKAPEAVQKQPEFVPSAPPESALNARLETLIDSLINDLVSLRGLLQVVGPKRP
ncbi:MAG: hypothetical protein WBE37_25665 [Bryobacteraceae bacterium]